MNAKLPRPDFLRPVARPSPLHWAWCATGLLVLAASALDAHAAWQQRAEALQRLARSSRPAAAAPVPTPPGQLARQAEEQRWLQQLGQPWPAVWAASEATDGVRWLAMAHGSTTGLRLTGLASDLAAAQAAAQALRDQQHGGHAVWQGVVLASVERVPEGQRFELAAQLAPQLAPQLANPALVGLP